MNRILALPLTLVVLSSLLCVPTQFLTVMASEPITINADGSVTPSTANIMSLDNITYYFTSDIVNQYLLVARANVIVDGAGNTLNGTGYGGVGVDISYGTQNVTIQNMKITGFGLAVNIEGQANYATIQNNSLIENDNGIQLSGDSQGLWVNGILNNSITTDNGTAIALGYKGGAWIIGNNVTGNYVCIGGYKGGARVYHNNFVNNTSLFSTTYVQLALDDGYPSGGNYWDGYFGTDEKMGPYQNETGSDLIGDTSFAVAIAYGFAIDRYPLMNFFGVSPIYPNPILEYHQIETGDTPVLFNASQSSCANGTITRYRWNFGDSTYGEGITTQHVFQSYGNYNVTLWVASNSGLKVAQTKQIYVKERPQAQFSLSTASPFLATQPITFDASESLALGGTITTYMWDFGDANIISTPDPVIVHTYARQNTYNVTLEVLDSEGIESENVTLSISMKMPTNVSISASSYFTLLGTRVGITGGLSDAYGQALENETVVLYYSFSGVDLWTPMSSTFTDQKGNYRVEWIPPATGNYRLKAEWGGNETHVEANSTASVVVTYENLQIAAFTATGVVIIVAGMLVAIRRRKNRRSKPPPEKSN